MKYDHLPKHLRPQSLPKIKIERPNETRQIIERAIKAVVILAAFIIVMNTEKEEEVR